MLKKMEIFHERIIEMCRLTSWEYMKKKGQKMSAPKKWTIACIVLASFAILSIAIAAEYYKLESVKRIDQNLYKTRDGLYIETQYCYHYTYGEDAVLKWEGAYGDNKIIWDDDSSCQVKRVWK